MISVAEALERMLAAANALPECEVELAAALGCVLARDIASDIDSPPWDKSLVDGYAVRAADVQREGAELTILEEVTAGTTPTHAVEPGTCTRIMTGAPLPAGADAVVMIERSELIDPSRVRMLTTAKPEQNLLRRAASMQRGQVVLKAGQVIRPIEIGVLAEVGRAGVPVIRKPRVAILSTGDELVEASRTPAAGQIRNSNGPMLAALVTAAGAEAIELGIARDNADDLRAKMSRGLEADVLILSGGVSAGVLDLVPQMLTSLGVREVLHKVNLKPGKPIWFGAGPQANLVFGLPGNPVSTLVCFGLFVKPTLAKLAGESDVSRSQRAILTQTFVQRDARPTYFPALFARDGQRDTVTPLAWRGSADLRTLADANCLAYFPGGERTFAAGEEMETFLL